MALTFKTEINIVEKSSVLNNSNVVLVKQAWEGDEMHNYDGHMLHFTADPTDEKQMTAVRDMLAGLDNMSIGLAPLSEAQIDQILAVHTGYWGVNPVAPPTKPSFDEIVAVAIDTQPEFAAVKAEVAAKVAAATAERVVMFGADALGLTDKKVDNVFIAGGDLK
jgi:hypothetical protein